ncbi:Pkinase-domain-containing protein [Ramicandelaber brevisporus]|nr:Pkinase-domain-containing protein [Ramicandelaber brevisporus]
MTAAAPPVAIEPSSTQTPSSSKYHHYYPTSTAATTTTNNNNNSNHHQYQNQQQQQQSSSSPSGTPRRSTTATGSSKNANILGSYFMMQTIGEGEFAKVKLAVHRTAPHREVAIKLIRKDNLDTFEKRSKVEREILALRSVSHPNIVRMVDLLDTDRYIGIVMEYASGGELFDYILAHKYLREKDACRLFAQLMSGVAHLHARRIVHRDLKLENLLLDKQRNIIITDFGFANQFGEDGGVTAAMHLMSTSCGSPCYAAPELVLSEGMYVGTAADIWSCGVILYAMLAGFLPYDDDPTNPDSENISQLYQYIMTTPLVYPDHIPEQAKLLLQRILVPDPAKRAGVKEISEHQWLKPHAAMLANQKLICENFFPPVTMPSASAAGSRATSAVSTPAVSPIAKPAPAVVTASQPVMPLPMSSSHAQSQSVTATGSSRSEYATATAAAISSSSVSSSQPTTTHSGHGASRREQSQSRPGQQQPSQNRFSIYGVVGSGMVLDLFRRGTSGVKQLASPSTEAAPNITITTEDSAAQLTAPYSPRPPSTVTQAVSIRQPLAVEPISDADDHRMAQRLLKIHTGPIDNSALTSLPPRKAFALVRQQVLDMGLVIVKERDFKIKVVRPIKPVLPSSSSAAQLNGGTPVGCDYLYGPDKQDSGGQVVFVIELHAIKYLPEMYVVSLTRRKGQLSSYKYLYDTFLAKLDIRSQGPLLPCKSSAAAAAATASSAIATQSNISGVLGASSDAASAFNVPMSPQMQSPPAITTSISNNTRERRHEQHASAASSPQPQPRHPSGRAGAISPIPSGSGRTAGNSASRQRPATTMFSPSDLILLSNQHQGQVQQQYPYYNGGTIKRNSMMAPQMVSQYA